MGNPPVVFLKDQKGELVADKETKQADDELEHGDLPGKVVLAEGPAPDEPEVEEGEVGRLGEGAVLGVKGDLEEAEAGEEAEQVTDEGPRLAIGGPGGDRGLEEAGAGVEAREAVTWAGDETENLGRGVEEVEDLGDEEEAQGLGEVTEDADDGKDHAGEVAVGVADKDTGRIPVVAEEGGRDTDPGEEEVE